MIRDDLPLATIELGDIDLWTAPRDERESVFATLRAHAPVRFFAERELPRFGTGPGYWAVTRYDDVWAASRNPTLFRSGQGTNIPDLPAEINEFMGSMINMDDPKHYRLRSIVAKGFTPREVARVDEQVKVKAATIVDGVLERHRDGACDFVEEIAAPLPLGVICEMMGIPAHDHRQIFDWTNVILGATDPDYGGDDGQAFDRLLGSVLSMFDYAQKLGQSRLDDARDDITSALMHAEVDGERLTTNEFGSFFILLAVAGNETTRNAISHGLKLLTDHPEQRDDWWGNWDAVTRTAVDEIVRYATPVIHFRRTATADTELGGQRIAAGEKVVLFYNSANRDERAFTDPHRFDVRRALAPQHAGFGAGGPHFCLGANLARREIAVLFDELRRRMPTIRATGEPAYLKSDFINGIKRLPCAWD